MAWGSFGLVLSGNLTLTEVAPFVNQIRDLLKFISFVVDGFLWSKHSSPTINVIIQTISARYHLALLTLLDGQPGFVR